MPFVDFNELKNRVSIEDAVAKLGLPITHKSQHALRAACPACKTGGDRALAITPAKSLYYCFAADAGGDQIALVAHIKGLSVRDAAEWLGGTTSTVQSTSTSNRKDHTNDSPSPGFQPLDYLEADHAATEALGFDLETAIALGIGYAPKGILRGTVAIPVRSEDGTLVGYIGITEARLGKFHLPSQKVVALHSKKSA